MSSTSIEPAIEPVEPIPALEDVSVDKFRSLLVELDREYQARLAAENSKSELQASFNRLKTLTHEAIKKRDEALTSKYEVAMKLDEALKESSALKQLVTEYDDRLSDLESKMEMQRAYSVDQLSLVSKIHNQLCSVVKIVDVKNLELERSESLFFPQGTDTEENMRASLAGMECTYELARIAVRKAREVVEAKDHETQILDETVTRLVREKDQIGSLLRGALPKRIIKSVPASRRNELSIAEENGLKEAGKDFKFGSIFGGGQIALAASNDSLENVEREEDEILSLAGALGDVVKASQLETMEFQHIVDELRAELSSLKQRVHGQAEELNHRMLRIKELEEKERVANENVEALMADIATAEDEINRWKVAAEQEAAVGRAVEQEFMLKLSALKMELEEAKQTMLEWEKNLKFKEETAAAAMAARDAVEESLKLADLRASRLRDRMEELTHQLEEFEKREDQSRGRNRHRYMCWPWQWLGTDFVGFHMPHTQQETSNEMELSEPLV